MIVVLYVLGAIFGLVALLVGGAALFLWFARWLARAELRRRLRLGLLTKLTSQ